MIFPACFCLQKIWEDIRVADIVQKNRGLFRPDYYTGNFSIYYLRIFSWERWFFMKNNSGILLFLSSKRRNARFMPAPICAYVKSVWKLCKNYFEFFSYLFCKKRKWRTFVPEEWQSGRMRWSWKPLYREVPGVRIPLPPQSFERPKSKDFGLFALGPRAKCISASATNAKSLSEAKAFQSFETNPPSGISAANPSPKTYLSYFMPATQLLPERQPWTDHNKLMQSCCIKRKSNYFCNIVAKRLLA